MKVFSLTALLFFSSLSLGLLLDPGFEGTYHVRFSCQKGSEFDYCKRGQAYTMKTTPLRMMVFNHLHTSTFVIIPEEGKGPAYHFTPNQINTATQEISFDTTERFFRKTPEMVLEYQAAKPSENTFTGWIRDPYFPFDLKVEAVQTVSAGKLSPIERATERPIALLHLVGTFDGELEGPGFKIPYTLRMKRSALDSTKYIATSFPNNPRQNFPTLEFRVGVAEAAKGLLHLTSHFDFYSKGTENTEEKVKYILSATENEKGEIFLRGAAIYSNGAGYYKLSFKMR